MDGITVCVGNKLYLMITDALLYTEVRVFSSLLLVLRLQPMFLKQVSCYKIRAGHQTFYLLLHKIPFRLEKVIILAIELHVFVYESQTLRLTTHYLHSFY